MSDWPSVPFAIAHRGFSLDGAENSLAAFQAAIDLGCRYLETDARATADGTAVAFHDSTLDRLTNHTGRVDRLNWTKVSQARIIGREPIPRLEDVLGLDPTTFVNIDVKADSAIGPTLDAIRRSNSWRRVRLASFSHRRLQTLRAAAGPLVASSLSPIEIAWLKSRAAPLGVGRFAQALWPTRQLPTLWKPAAQVPHGLGLPVIDRRFVAEAHREGIEVHAWTVNDPGAMRQLLDCGVDAIVTDRPDRLHRLLSTIGPSLPGYDMITVSTRTQAE
jgi:glycerophosphoryl diester phosphodiesterase